MQAYVYALSYIFPVLIKKYCHIFFLILVVIATLSFYISENIRKLILWIHTLSACVCNCNMWMIDSILNPTFKLLHLPVITDKKKKGVISPYEDYFAKHSFHFRQAVYFSLEYMFYAMVCSKESAFRKEQTKKVMCH